MRHALAALFLLSALTALGACGGAPDLVLVNAVVFTGDDARPRAEAVAVKGERLIAVGGSAEVLALAGPETRRVDAGGRVVIPGINDAHVHLGLYPGGVVKVDFSAAANVADLMTGLAEADRRAPAEAYLAARIDALMWLDPALTRVAVDHVASTHPVIIETSTGHGVVLNSAAMAFLGVDERVPDLPGGRFGRDESGRLNGRGDEYVTPWIGRRLSAKATQAEAVAQYRTFAREALAYGITTVQVMSINEPMEAAVRHVRATDSALRWRLVRWPMPPEGAERFWSDTQPFLPPQPTARIRVSGLNWMLDGTPIERGAFMRAPYADAPGVTGRLNIDPARLREVVGWAYGSEDPLHVHAVGDAALEALLAAMEDAGVPSVWQRKRPRIEHGDMLTADLRTRARALGAVVVPTPARSMFPQVMRARLGARAAQMLPLESLLDERIPLALGSDGLLNPYLNILFATTHPTRPDEALSRVQAVMAYTRGSAYAEFTEREKGVLAPGALADLAVLSDDLFTVPDDALPTIVSVWTLVGGRVAHDAGLLGPAPRVP